VLRRSIPLVAVLALGVAAPAASAAPTGTFAAGTLTITVPANDVAVLSRSVGTMIINGTITPAPPTVEATNSVIVTTGGNSRTTLDLTGGPFRKGSGAEVPVAVNSTVGADQLRITGSGDPEVFAHTNLGIDLNDDAENNDVTLNQVETLVLDGGGGNDTITGFTADEYLLGGEGDDTLVGNTGIDVLLGDAGNDDLQGGFHADALDGGPGNDTLQGGDDSDLLENSPGDDVLDGGPQNIIGAGDRVAHTNMAAAGTIANGVAFDLQVATPQANGSAGTDTLLGIEDAGGTPFDDVLRGTGANNRLDGGAGNDLLDGRAFQDRITGGNGNDTLLLGANEDTADAGPGADHVDSVDGGADTVTCGPDADTFSADAADSLTECEGPPKGPPPPPPGGGDTSPRRLTLTAPRTIKVRRNAVAFAVRCPASAAGDCEATATLRAKVGKRTRTLGARRFTLLPGAGRTVRVKLTSSARRMLKSKRKLKATIRVTFRDDRGAGPTATRKVTLKR
jgi:Ca2+-binding RTX toxin-like protein